MAERRDYFVACSMLNYIRRTVPQSSAGSPRAAHGSSSSRTSRAKADLSLITDCTIPPVDAAIYGTVIIFVSFGFVQMLFHGYCRALL